MIDFTMQKWVSMLALSGVLVTSGLVGVAPSQAAVLDVRNRAVMASLSKIQVSKSYLDTVRAQLNWRRAFISTEFADATLARTDTLNNVKVADGSTKKVESSAADVTAKTVAPSIAVAATKSPAPPTAAAEPKTASAAPKAAAKTPVAAPVSRGSSTVDKIISRAYSLKGIPYEWGGTTTNGFDCSGFVQYVFRSVGISLPRTAEEQYKVGTPVSRSELKPGDLVFFQTYKPGASDVRIYIGGGKTIGSSTSDGVAIHSLSESYWNKHYLGARRVIQ